MDIRTLVDIRLNNTSQLAGFAKKEDLAYIMELVGIHYIHDVSLAPTSEILEAYKKKKISGSEFGKLYVDLLEKRRIQDRISEIIGEGVPCFLCSEDDPHHCHRRYLAEYLQKFDPSLEIVHLR